MSNAKITRRRKPKLGDVPDLPDPHAGIRELRAEMTAMLRVGHGDDAHRTRLEFLRHRATAYRERYPDAWREVADEECKS